MRVLLAGQAVERKTKLPGFVAAAQAIHESGWGRSGLTVVAKNTLGIKARPGEPYIAVPSWEVVGGKNRIIVSKFRRYPSLEACIDHWGTRILAMPEYLHAVREARGHRWRYFLREVSEKWASDPRYYVKVKELIERYGLHHYGLPGSDWR